MCVNPRARMYLYNLARRNSILSRARARSGRTDGRAGGAASRILLVSYFIIGAAAFSDGSGNSIR